MLFKEIYNFQLSKNKDILTQNLKALSKEEIREGDYTYSVEFSWDEFIVTAKAKILQRNHFTADAHIRLTGLPEDHTEVGIQIKFSEITWIFFIFIQLGITAACLFVAEFNWWGRIALLIGVSGACFFIIRLALIWESRALKKVISKLFEHPLLFS